MSKWSFTIEMDQLKPSKAKLLQLDIEYMAQFILVKSEEAIERAKKMRGVANKLPNLGKTTEMLKMALALGDTNLESLKKFQKELFEYKLETDTKTRLTIYIDEIFFQMWSIFGDNKLIEKLIPSNFTTKKGFMKKFEETIRNDYTNKYKIWEGDNDGNKSGDNL